MMMDYSKFYVHDLRLVHLGHRTEQKTMLSARLTFWVMSKVPDTPPEDLLVKMIIYTKIGFSYLAFTISPEIDTNTHQVVHRRIRPLIQQGREQRTEWVYDKANFNTAMWP